MTAINAFICRTRAGSKIISPIGLELESPAFGNLAMPGGSGTSSDLLDYFREQIIRTCWSLRGIRQGCMACHKNRLKKAFADENTREWGKRFTKPQFHASFSDNAAANPVCTLLSDFLGLNKRQNRDIQKLMSGFELHISKLVLAMEAYCLSRSMAGGVNFDSEMMENLSWTEDWLTKLQTLAAQRFSFSEYYLVHADVNEMLFCVVNDAAETAFYSFLAAFSQWEQMPRLRTVQEALIVRAVVLKLHLDELERIGHPGRNYYVKEIERLLKKNESKASFR